MNISPHALVHPKAQLGSDVHIEAFARVEADVKIGNNTWIGAQASILSGTNIGNGVKIFQGAVVGGDPQDLKYKGEVTTLEIGNHVTIREYCTINRGTAASNSTIIKDHALIMAYSHIAHDCYLEEHVIIANACNLAGHVTIGPFAIIGGMTAIQQFVRVGEHAFVGGGTLVRKDIPPYIRVAREPLSYIGINSIGLKRRGFEQARIKLIQDIYRILFVRHDNLRIAIDHMKEEIPDCPEKEDILEFLAQSELGVIRGFRQVRTDDN